MVTAEAALVLPLVAIFALVVVWLITVGIAQVRAVDAARDAARSIARGDDTGSATEAARRTAGRAAQVEFSRAGDLLSVQVSEQVTAPGWLLVPLPAVTVRARSSVEVEDAPSGR